MRRSDPSNPTGRPPMDVMHRIERFVGVLLGSRLLLTTTGFVIATWVVNAVLGFGFWWVASRSFSPEAVGLASAIVSASLLMGRLTVTGLGTSLAGFLPTYRGSRPSLVLTALIVAAWIGVSLGLLFALVAPAISPEFSRFLTGVPLFVLFMTGTGLVAVGVVLDQVLVSIRQGHLQLLRNLVFAASKLGLIVVAIAVVGGDSAIPIFTAWVVAEAISLTVLALLRRTRDVPTSSLTFDWPVVYRLSRNALGHHAISIARTGPALLMPVLVTSVLSASANAAFYVTLILTTALQVIATSATFTLYAVGARSVDALRHQLRLMLGLSFALVGVGIVALLVLGPWILGLFGPSYVEQAGGALPWLAAAAIPLVITDYWIALRRIRQDARGAIGILMLGAVLQVSLAYLGATTGGLTGLAMWWFIALVLQSLLMVREVVLAAFGHDPSAYIQRRAVPGVAVDALVFGAEGPDSVSVAGADPVNAPGAPEPVHGPSPIPAPRVGHAASTPISVFIPVWNDATWLPGAIESVLAQTHTNWELVIGDNASSDDLRPIVAGYDDPRIRYHRFDTHTDLLQNWNRTVRLCSHPWVQGLAADDRIRPTCLERIAETIESVEPTVPRLVMVLTACRRLDPAGAPADRTWYGTKPKLPVVTGVYDPAGWLELCTTDGQPPWNNGSVAVSHAAIDEMGGLMRPEIGLSADFEMAMRMGAYGHVAFLEEPLLDFTVRSTSDGPARLEFNRARGVGDTVVGLAYQNALHVYEEIRGLSPQQRRRILDSIARSHLQRAAQHRVLPHGQGRRGALRDFLRVWRWSSRVALSPRNFAYGLAAVIAPRRLLEYAKTRLTDRLHAGPVGTPTEQLLADEPS
jgi:O-antigen/teichoic acid export membrane protein